MKKISPILFALTFLVLINSFYILKEGEQAIVTQFGKPVGDSKINAGLKFKIPLIQKVIVFDKRILEWDGAANEIPTKDNKYILIDAFARWKISDPLQFYKAARNQNTAQSRLDDILDGAVRDEISTKTMQEIIRSSDRSMNKDEDGKSDQSTEVQLDEPGARLEIINNILLKASSKMVELNMGIEILDVQLKRLDYTSRVQNDLFNRMISEQNMRAEKYRAQGQGKKQEILGQQIQDEKKIISDAYKVSQKIIGDADARAIKIYADAYNKDPEFYDFIKSLDAYEKTLDSNSQIIISTDSEFFKYLK